MARLAQIYTYILKRMISRTVHSTVVKFSVRSEMATASGRRKRVRFTLDINFESDVAKEAFFDKLTAVRNLLMPRGSQRLDNCELLSALFDCALTNHQQEHSEATDQDLSVPSTGSFLRNVGLHYCRIRDNTYL